ncbi:zona pellucida sperm-binding protein 3-like [Melanotaenia boesemani]|uniref:zona pellucida sperm-binding protein 3-like n=1 Tax=Melanotaenia boesemani TaxID=1250792 RepID=UPI001C03BA7F|nr:zona pellucida sperm-binding protein 3-like [Melanotaenia boesemani]XP_041842367.1 zona pellucida sperm-binding protein 3-like [Melanotaenia boesemani]
MTTTVKYSEFIKISAILLCFCGVVLAEKSTEGNRESDGLEIECEEIKVRITVKRTFFQERRIPFKPEFLRLGVSSMQTSSCGPQRTSDTVMVITAGLQDCGTESSVHGDWLVYSNQLLLLPAVVPTSTGSVIVRRVTTVIPIECHYERKQEVKGQPLQPTWVPMTSTVAAIGLLNFSLRIMADGCTSSRSSSVYQQGEAVFLEASVEAQLHPSLTLYVDYCVATLNPDPLSRPSYRFIDKHGCHMDSALPGSSSRFLPREQNNKLCFSVQAFHFNQMHGEQMFISCHLGATLKQKSHSYLNKTCFFHGPTFSWRATEGDSALCECCDSSCLRPTKEKNYGDTTQPDTGEKHEADRTVGPIHTLHHSYWTGRMSVSH